MKRDHRAMYIIGAGVGSMILGLTVVVFIYSHLRLAQFDSTFPQVELLISESPREEQELMESIRVISGATMALIFPVGVVINDRYYRTVDSLQGELKVGIIMAVLLSLSGVGIYATASSIETEAIGLLFFVMGAVGVIINAIYKVRGQNDQ